jgi:hypothetical protein
LRNLSLRDRAADRATHSASKRDSPEFVLAPMHRRERRRFSIFFIFIKEADRS